MNLDFIKGLIPTDSGIEFCDYATQMDYVGNDAESKQLPSVFFHLFQEKALPNEFTGPVRQEVEVYVAFKVVDKNKNLDVSRKILADAILGYTQDDWLTSFEYVGGEVVDVVKSVIWWRDIYKVKIFKTGA